MPSKKDILDIFFEMVKSCVENITLPTGSTLLPTFLFSLLIFVVSALSSLFGLFTLVHWQGALVSVLLIMILAIVEGRGKSELLKLYRIAESGAATIKSRAKSTNTSVKSLKRSRTR